MDELKSRYLHINLSRNGLSETDNAVSAVTNSNYLRLRELLSGADYFGRSDVIRALDLSNSGASKLIAKLLDVKLIEPVKGYGKGKYRFTGQN